MARAELSKQHLTILVSFKQALSTHLPCAFRKSVQDDCSLFLSYLGITVRVSNTKAEGVIACLTNWSLLTNLWISFPLLESHRNAIFLWLLGQMRMKTYILVVVVSVYRYQSLPNMTTSASENSQLHILFAKMDRSLSQQKRNKNADQKT